MISIEQTQLWDDAWQQFRAERMADGFPDPNEDDHAYEEFQAFLIEQESLQYPHELELAESIISNN